MKTKYFLMLIVACVMGTQVMNAQDTQMSGKKDRKRPTPEQITEMQCRKIIDDLGLDDKTAAKFTDVYRKYMKELNDLRMKHMPKKPAMKQGEPKAPKQLTDEEVDKMMRERFAQGRKMLDVREKYYDEFRKFLSPKQVQKVYDHGQMNRNLFHIEMNRRAGMKHERGGGHPHQGRQAQQK